MPRIVTIRSRDDSNRDNISLVMSQVAISVGPLRTSNRALGHLGLVGVVHDGSLQGHRAFQAALELARRPMASLDLVGVFGICGETGDASRDADDYEW